MNVSVELEDAVLGDDDFETTDVADHTFETLSFPGHAGIAPAQLIADLPLLAPDRAARLLAQALLRVGTFDPNQPRDKDGQWSGGGSLPVKASIVGLFDMKKIVDRRFAFNPTSKRLVLGPEIGPEGEGEADSHAVDMHVAGIQGAAQDHFMVHGYVRRNSVMATESVSYYEHTIKVTRVGYSDDVSEVERSDALHALMKKFLGNGATADTKIDTGYGPRLVTDQMRVLKNEATWQHVSRSAALYALIGTSTSGNYGHAGRPKQQGGSAPSAVPFLGEHDLPVFDEHDEHSPEWLVLLAHDQFLDDLDQDSERGRERHALREYKGVPDRINEALRRDPDLMDKDLPDVEQGAWQFQSRDAQIAETARAIEDAMDEAPRIKAPVTVYRGLRGATAKEFLKSESVTLNGFQSTSFDPRVAAAFLGMKEHGLATGVNPQGVLLQITAKYGLALGHAHSIAGEMEMLLPHGGSYAVTGVSRVRHAGGVFPVIHLRQR